MTPAELLSTWSGLSSPTVNSELEANEVLPDSGMWAAVDYSGREHFLVLIDGEGEVDLEETHGLSVAVVRYRIAGRDDAPYIDLVCHDREVLNTFAAVASEIARVAGQLGLGARLDAVLSTVREWRWFWGADPNRMTRTDAVGLFGELWFLHRWAGVTASSVRAWEGSSGSRHDFQWPLSSVEVKTTSRTGAVMHTIENLEQLEDPEQGHLYLYSLRLGRDSLAANSVNSLVAAARHALMDDPVSRSELMEKLAKRGYRPLGRDETEVTYRVLDECLYRVTSGFPRLTRRDFPSGLRQGIVGISYRLDMSACEEWRSDAVAGRWQP